MDDDGDYSQDEQNVDCESGDVIQNEAANPYEHQKKSKQQPDEPHLSSQSAETLRCLIAFGNQAKPLGSRSDTRIGNRDQFDRAWIFPLVVICSSHRRAVCASRRSP
jgi:hypothetical protein